MGEMASSIAHELNQPLAAINNYCMGVITRVKNYSDPNFQSEILPALEKPPHRHFVLEPLFKGLETS
jgi:signal transduction histidine kinase